MYSLINADMNPFNFGNARPGSISMRACSGMATSTVALCAHAARFFQRTLNPSQASATTRGIGLDPVR
jgi:hypothetical protein